MSRRGRLDLLRPFERRKVCLVDAGTDTVIEPLSYLGVTRAIMAVGPQRDEEGRLGPDKSRCMAVIPALQRLRQEDCHECEASLGYKVRPCFI